MKITVIGRKCTPRDSFKERAEKKLSKIERFLGSEVETKITATVEKTAHIVEVTIKAGSMLFRAEEAAPNMNDALDKCVDSLVRQIRKNKTRLEKKLHAAPDAFEALVSEDAVEEEVYFEIVRTKSVSLKPQTADEAVLQMNLLEHQFYMFLNAETETINVVYRRKDGGYGLLVPDIE